MASSNRSFTPQLTRSGSVIVASAASVIQMLMMIPGYSEHGSLQLGEWLTVLAISLVLSVALFLLAVPKGGITLGIVLGVLSVASVLIFWAGLTLPLAAAAAALGWRLRRDGNTAGPLVALALALLATVALVAIIISDAVAN